MVETARELKAKLSVIKEDYDKLREKYNELIRRGKKGTRWAKAFKPDEIKELRERLKQKREEFYTAAQQYEYAKIGEQTHARSEQEKFMNYLGMLLQKGIINQKLYDTVKKRVSELSTEDAKTLIALLFKMIRDLGGAVKEGLITKEVSGIILNLLGEGEKGTARELLKMIDRLRSGIQRGLFTKDSETFKELQEYMEEIKIKEFNNLLNTLNLEALREEPEKALEPAVPEGVEPGEEAFKHRVLNVAVTYNKMNIIDDEKLGEIKKLLDEDEADKAQGILEKTYQQYLKQKKEGRITAPAQAVTTPTTPQAETAPTSTKDLRAVLSEESKNKLLKALREKGLA
ncbi:hypothetical protein GF352_01945 [archaeon]|nr:hypothetical protein [archaeon]